MCIRDSLEIFGPVILESEAVLIGSGVERPGADTLLRRLQGVLVARQYVLLDYDVPVDTTSATASATPSRTADSTAPSSFSSFAVTPCPAWKSPTRPG